MSGDHDGQFPKGQMCQGTTVSFPKWPTVMCWPRAEDASEDRKDEAPQGTTMMSCPMQREAVYHSVTRSSAVSSPKAWPTRRSSWTAAAFLLLPPSPSSSPPPPRGSLASKATYTTTFRSSPVMAKGVVKMTTSCVGTATTGLAVSVMIATARPPFFSAVTKVQGSARRLTITTSFRDRLSPVTGGGPRRRRLAWSEVLD